jgi:hypothetical protein
MFAKLAGRVQTKAMPDARDIGAPRLHCLAWMVVLPMSALAAGDAFASSVTPVVITMLGPGAVRLRVAKGSTLPCDSGDNQMLVEGKFAPGELVRTSTPEACVCVQQTYEPFPDIDWAEGALVCRPQICTWAGRSKRCIPAADPTIRISVRSKRGG